MDLKSWLKNYPGMRIANTADNTKILAFYDQQPMNASTMGLQFKRAPDFFAMMTARSDRNVVLLHEDSSGKIQGIGTFSFREGFIGGNRKTVGYLGDLRIGQDRSLLRVWKNFYADLLAEGARFSEMAHASDYLTAVVDDNSAARRALVEDKRGLLQYTRVSGYNMVNVFRRFAFFGPRKSSLFFVSQLQIKDFTELCEFFESENRHIDFGFAGSEILRRTAAWPGLLRENGIVVRDLQGRICGFTWLWSSNDVKSIYFQTTSTALKTAGALVPGLPRSGEKIGFFYMTALTVAREHNAREEIKALLLDRSYEIFRQSNCNFLSMCEFESDSYAETLRPYICFRTPMALYSVTARTNPKPKYSGNIGFEMAIV